MAINFSSSPATWRLGFLLAVQTADLVCPLSARPLLSITADLSDSVCMASLTIGRWEGLAEGLLREFTAAAVGFVCVLSLNCSLICCELWAAGEAPKKRCKKVYLGTFTLDGTSRVYHSILLICNLHNLHCFIKSLSREHLISAGDELRRH